MDISVIFDSQAVSFDSAPAIIEVAQFRAYILTFVTIVEIDLIFITSQQLNLCGIQQALDKN